MGYEEINICHECAEIDCPGEDKCRLINALGNKKISKPKNGYEAGNGKIKYNKKIPIIIYEK